MVRDEERFGRRITDPRALRALAHRGRLAILERLQIEGPATATECAQVTGLSPSACSYHLRLLARYGFVEEAGPEDRAEDRDDGRERVWRATVRGWQSEPAEETDPAEARAIDAAVGRALLDMSDEKVLAFLDDTSPEAAQWRDAALLSNSTIVVTRDELAQLSEQLMQVLSPYFASARAPDDTPADARLVHVALRLTPRTS